MLVHPAEHVALLSEKRDSSFQELVRHALLLTNLDWGSLSLEMPRQVHNGDRYVKVYLMSNMAQAWSSSWCIFKFHTGL